MSNKLSLSKIKAQLNEATKAADPFKNTEKVNLKTSSSAKGTKAPSATADKMKPGAKGTGAPKLKQLQVKTAKNTGPAPAPKSEKIKGTKNASAEVKAVSAPKLSVKSGQSKTPLASADGFSMDLSKLGVKWAKTRELSQWEKSDLEGTGIMSDKTKKVSFSVSMPKIDYGIVTHDTNKIPSSQSPKFKEVKNVKLMKEGLINGQVVVKLPNNVYTFDVMTAKELKSICENYSKIGQSIEVVFKPLVRKLYLNNGIKKALAEAVHYNMNNLKNTYTEKLSEGKKAVKTALTESHSDFFVSDKKAFVSENFKAVMKEGYSFYKMIYEGQLQPYDVTVRAYTSNGKERFKIVTKALSEAHAAYNAFSEVLSETGVSTKIDSGFVGAKKFTMEDVSGILSKTLKFDIDTKDFAKAGPQKTKKSGNAEVTVPKIEKVKLKSKAVVGAEKVAKMAKGGVTNVKKKMNESNFGFDIASDDGAETISHSGGLSEKVNIKEILNHPSYTQAAFHAMQIARAEVRPEIDEKVEKAALMKHAAIIAADLGLEPVQVSNYLWLRAEADATWGKRLADQDRRDGSLQDAR